MKLLVIAGLVAGLSNAFGAFVPTDTGYEANHYLVRITINPAVADKTFSAQLQMKLTAKTELKKLALDLRDLDIHSVSGPGHKALAFEVQDAKRLIVELPHPLAKGAATTLTIDYSGKINSGHHGLFRVEDPDDASRGPMLFTQFEAQAAREFFPCDDQPFAKATFEMIATVPAKYGVISNGALVSDKKIKGKTPLHEVHW